MSRFVDRGAITAAYVGIGMGVTIVASFTLIIPIEPVIWALAVPSGLVIGYYANQRSDRRAGPWGRILINGLFAGVVTGLTIALLLLTIKTLFFYADNGFRDPGQGGPIACSSGADCVHQRYLQSGQGPALAAAGVTDADAFASFYWNQQFGIAGAVVVWTALGGLGGAALYGVFRPKPAGAGAGTGSGSAAT